MTTALTLTPAQQEIFAGMPKAWQQKAMQSLESLRGAIHLNVMTRYELGEVVRDMTEHESRYGEAAVQKLGMLLGESAQNLWHYQTCARAYTRPMLKALLERSGKAAWPLSWSHLRLLSSVKNGKERKRLEVATIEKKFTVEDLQERVGRIEGRRKGAGKKPEKPRSTTHAMGQIQKFADQIINRSGDWDQIVYAHYQKPSAKVAQEEAEQLESTHAKIVEARKTIQLLESHSEATLSKVHAQLANTNGHATNGHATNGATAAAPLKKRVRPSSPTALSTAGTRKKKIVKKGTKRRRLQTA
jgi:hypothetical protein